MRSGPKHPQGELVTLEEFRRMPEEDAYRVELSRGRVVREPRPGAEHGWLAGRLVGLLSSHVEEHALGVVATETGFLLREHPSTVRGPDVAFVSEDRLSAEGIPRGFWTVPPDLAVEVVSPSNTAAEIQEKVLEYLEAGTQLVWVVDPMTRSVTVWIPPAEAHVLRDGEVLDGGAVLPEFRLEVSTLFRR